MRGTPERQMAMLTTLSPEVLIPGDHPIRRIRAVVDAVLADLHGEWFCAVAWDGSLVTRRGHVARLRVRSRARAANLLALTKP